MNNIDLLVAEKIMGWTRKTWTNLDWGGGDKRDYWMENRHNIYPVDSFNPTNNIVHAMQVVAKMPGCWFINKISGPDGEIFWAVNYDYLETTAHAETAELAICKSALLYKEKYE